MKKIKNTIVYTLLTVLGLSTTLSCKKDFIDVNIDPIGEREVEARRLLQPALVNVLYANMIRNWNFNNQLMQVSVEISDAEGKIFRYDVRRTWADYTWNSWYTNMTDLKDIYTIASKPESLNKSYQGISFITQTWVSSLITDTYGDVPYSEANMGRSGNMQPVFDKQKDIYADMFKKLEEANELLKEGTAIDASDPVYKGDISKWRRFGNSLYLRLLLRASGKIEVAGTVKAKIKEMIDTNPAEYPIIENNSQTAKILWNGTNSSTAVYSSPYMIGIRAVDFRNMPICDFFLGRLVTWEDPRVDPDLGAKSGVPRFCIDKGIDGYVGVPSGYTPGSGVIIQAHFNSDADSDKPTLQTDPNTGIIMNSAEVKFILAEAAAKGWIVGSAQDYYNKGIFDGINYWMPTYFSGLTDAKFVSYINKTGIKWDSSLPLDNLAGGKSQMEMIHIQKYYANFLVDFQQWFEYRRTGHPFLPKGPGLANGGVMPARLNYPLVTQSTNPTNYKNAVANQGADDINTLVWWQKP
jgi:hypothetical protein